MKVAVVGGGVTGLAAAYELERRSVETVLIEAAPRLGGKIGTERADGFLIEDGPDGFVTVRPDALVLCRELGLEAQLVEPRVPRILAIFSGGRLLPMPEGLGPTGPTRFWPFLATPLLGPAEKLRAALDLVLPRSTIDGDVAVGPFLRRRLGVAVVDRLVGPLIEAIYRCDVDELSLRAAVPHLLEMERRHRSLLLASRAAARATRGTRSMVVAPRRGMGELVDRLVAALVGTEIRVATGVRSIERAAGGYRLPLGDGGVIEAEAVVVTVPPAVSAGLLRSVRPVATQLLSEFPVASTAVVTFAFDRPDLPSTALVHGILVAASERLRVRAVTWSSEKWEGRAPSGTGLLRAFVNEPELVQRDDRDIVAAVRHDLEQIAGLTAEPLLHRVRRLPGAMPRYRVGHVDHLGAVDRVLAPEHGRLVVAGAFYRGSGVSDCIRQGREAAIAVIRSSRRAA